MMSRKILGALFCFMFAVTAGSGSVWAQGAKKPKAGAAKVKKSKAGAVRTLRGALKSAGGSELTSEQAEQVKAFVKASGAARKAGKDAAQAASSVMRANRQAYGDAILSSDSATAAGIAGLIADGIAQRQKADLKARANLKVNILGVLTQDQIDVLSKRRGSSGLFAALGARRVQNGKGPRGGRRGGSAGPIRSLAGALRAANASALTSAQVDQLKALRTEFAAARKAVAQSRTRTGTRSQYAAAILSSDIATAEAMADAIANASAASMESNLTTGANRRIQVLNVLTQGQADTLISKRGTGGLLRLLGAVSSPSRAASARRGRSR
ncbi:MAG: hypothetical protein VYA53_07035 [Acidobacteriota bacterium]|nr:hypothetical protein [Acidobacteriota bacterium]